MISPFLDLLLGAAAAVSLLPCGTLLAEIATAGRTPPRPPPAGPPPPFAVLMPAHDEAEGIEAALRGVLSELRPGDRLLVVADNCTDATAAVAASLGAEVLVRTDPERRGKGFALQCGLNHLAATDPPPVLVVLDADCRVQPGGVAALVATASASGRPVQGLYLMTAGDDRGARIGAFAVRVKNQLRPLGCLALGWPCPLTGSGMAFPWEVIRHHQLGSAEIVEDMALGLELTLAGTPPLFCPEAIITSPLPGSAAGRLTQRTRWEQGHLAIIGRFLPRLLTAANGRGLWAALDLCLPPLTLLAAGLLGLTTATLAWAGLGGGWLPALLQLLSLAAFAASLGLAWRLAGRDLLTAADLVTLPGYLLDKARLYLGLLRGRRIGWVRAERR